MIGRIHQCDSITIQIEVVVKEPALAQQLPRSQFEGRDPRMSTIALGVTLSGGVARRGAGIRARAFLEPHANGPRSLACLAIIVHFAMVLDLARKLNLRSAYGSVVRALGGTVAK